jgi:surface protein
MKHINNFINEKLIINSSTKKHTIKVNNKEEFRKAVDKIIEESQDKENINLNSIDVSHLVDMTRLLRKYTNIKKLDVSSWDVSQIKSMAYMFPPSLETVDLSDWDVSEVQTMEGMFLGCKNLKEIGDISNWETKSLENTSDMFSNCKSIKKIDISNWIFSKIRKLERMFTNCENLESIGNITKDTLLKFPASNLDMFLLCKKLKK